MPDFLTHEYLYKEALFKWLSFSYLWPQHDILENVFASYPGLQEKVCKHIAPNLRGIRVHHFKKFSLMVLDCRL